jgi:hypothetical protein
MDNTFLRKKSRWDDNSGTLQFSSIFNGEKYDEIFMQVMKYKFSSLSIFPGFRIILINWLNLNSSAQ